MKGFSHDAGNLSNIFYQITVFDERRAGPRDIHFLENVSSQNSSGNLSRNRDHRDAVHERRGDSRDEIGRPRTGRDDAYADPTRLAGITGRHMSRVLLLSD